MMIKNFSSLDAKSQQTFGCLDRVELLLIREILTGSAATRAEIFDRTLHTEEFENLTARD